MRDVELIIQAKNDATAEIDKVVEALRELQSLDDVLAVVSPESYPKHLRDVFVTRDPKVADRRAHAIGGTIYRVVDMDRTS